MFLQSIAKSEYRITDQCCLINRYFLRFSGEMFMKNDKLCKMYLQSMYNCVFVFARKEEAGEKRKGQSFVREKDSGLQVLSRMMISVLRSILWDISRFSMALRSRRQAFLLTSTSLLSREVSWGVQILP